MNQIGMLIDVSHAGYNTARQSIEYSQRPIVFSHSNAWALCKSARNIPDELLLAIKENNGIVGLNAFSPLLKANVAYQSIIA